MVSSSGREYNSYVMKFITEVEKHKINFLEKIISNYFGNRTDEQRKEIERLTLKYLNNPNDKVITLIEINDLVSKW